MFQQQNGLVYSMEVPFTYKQKLANPFKLRLRKAYGKIKRRGHFPLSVIKIAY